MAWLGKVSLGGFPDLAGTVAKLSESVKNIEKNFDSALGLEERPDSGEATTSGIWPSASDRKALFDPVMAFMGHKGDDSATEELGDSKSPEQPSSDEEHGGISTQVSPEPMVEKTATSEDNEDSESRQNDGANSHIANVTSNELGEPDKVNDESELKFLHTELALSINENTQITDSVVSSHNKKGEESEISEEPDPEQMLETTKSYSVEGTESIIPLVSDDKQDVSDSHRSNAKPETEGEQFVNEDSPGHGDMLPDMEVSLKRESSGAIQVDILNSESTGEIFDEHLLNSSISESTLQHIPDHVPHDIDESSETLVISSPEKDTETTEKEQSFSDAVNSVDSTDFVTEIERVRKEMKFMEAALQGAARQSQAKADEIAKLMNENEQLKCVIEDLKSKSTEAEIDVLRDEYHQRVAALERKVYALTRERDTLRREQSRKSDAAALLKEKDEIISQVMAEGEELSKKQAAQESTIRKLRAQVREFEEEKQRLNSKLQVEETKVESIKKDKAATEKLLQETIERNQADFAAQKEFYTNALNAAKEAEAQAEARANNEARGELESRLREAADRESMLVQTLEELRQTLSRTEQQAVFREDMLRRDNEELQRRYQESEIRYNELNSQVPESTRPLLRQIEAMQESSARRQEAWTGVERALNSRLQEAEAKAAAAEERERAMSERLSQTLSRITILETQNTCLRTEQKQLSRSLEKERQRASENRQEYLAAMEEAATQEGRAKQLEDEIKELRSRIKHELQEEVTRRELIEKELEKERDARLELERRAPPQTSAAGTNTYVENGKPPLRSLSSSGSQSSMEESLFLQASLDSSESYFSERRIPGETTMSPYFLKSMTPSAFEAALRQKDGELSSYISRLASLESIRDSLAEELVKMTAECEKLRAEAANVPGLRAELEALRRRHSSALELMGERDEELEELRADIMDLKEMYREQVDLLVNRLQMLNSSVAAA